MNNKIAVAIVGAGIVSGCSVSPEYDKSVGEQNSKMVEAQMGLYQKHQLDEYVDQVGQRLVAQLENPEFEFSFHIVDDTTPNAFALPGGYIYISRGLLALMNNEDELACVLAHEIIHVTERHSVKQMKRSILPGLTQVPGNIVGSVISEDLGALINAPLAVGSGLFMASYSRGHETQSDELGVRLAVKAGYNPYAMGVILTRLNEAVEFTTQQQAQKSYFDSHPYTPERVEHVNQWATQFSNAFAPPADGEFVQELDGLLLGSNPDKGVFVEDDYLHPQLGFSMHFPAEWQKVNQPNAVAAANKAQTGMVALTLVNADYNAEQVSQQFSQYMQQRFDYKVEISQYKNDWGTQTYHAQVRDQKEGKPVFLDQYWLDVDELTYQIMSVSQSDTVVATGESALSFKPITDKQRQSIKQREMMIVKVQQGENISQLLKRVDSPMQTKGVEILNGLASVDDIEAGDSLKVIIKAPYTSNQ
ncbi:M48 family metalloprotease [Vibrio agarivorans]|uniref:M48 family metalloprotease n=1 Tax=Vibrio agarivorans TaxID=153622 RepID=UPI0025B5C0BA|nr:M48 family metalloprotease [Vibrio agarivorans]MDN3660841.1 M48 family metalloprotease [Vibrio agarivorans]